MVRVAGMSDKTGIAWTDATWNPVTGCSKVSQGCKHCYAEREWGRLSANPKAMAYYGRAFTDIACHEDRLDQPLRWKKPRMIFVNSMSDLFHEDVPDDFIDRVFAVMALAEKHTFQVLTKRPERMLRWFDPGFDNREHAVGQAMREIAAARGGDDAGLPEWPLPNVWLGVSVEDQATADDRIPLLLRAPAAIHWVSAEPLLDFVDLERVAWPGKGGHRVDVLRGGYWNKANCIALGPSADLGEAKGGFTNHSDFPATLDWVVCGGESSFLKARSMRAEWVRSIIQQCREADTPIFVKQLGSNFMDCEQGIVSAATSVQDQESVRHAIRKRGRLWPHTVGVIDPPVRVLSSRTGANMDEWPEDLRVREWPAAVGNVAV